MGQKVNPISNRIGIIRGWDSNWYGGKDYSSKILEDTKIRQYLEARLASASLSKIVIERTLKLITVTIHTARPGIIIGKGGSEVEKLKEELKNITKKDIQINIYEVKRPEADANIVAQSIARQVEGRVSYRRAIKMAVSTTMQVCNTTYAYQTMKNGNSYARALSSAKQDYLKVVITGYAVDGTVTGTTEFHLADFRTSTSVGIIDNWTEVDLATLGTCHKITFSIEGSDTGTMGLNTPAYFAFDNLIFKKTL
jgi:ribosomal protein S3, bacterial type